MYGDGLSHAYHVLGMNDGRRTRLKIQKQNAGNARLNFGEEASATFGEILAGNSQVEDSMDVNFHGQALDFEGALNLYNAADGTYSIRVTGSL
jgi:hypothetical protein